MSLNSNKKRMRTGTSTTWRRRHPNLAAYCLVAAAVCTNTSDLARICPIITTRASSSSRKWRTNSFLRCDAPIRPALTAFLKRRLRSKTRWIRPWWWMWAHLGAQVVFQAWIKHWTWAGTRVWTTKCSRRSTWACATSSRRPFKTKYSPKTSSTRASEWSWRMRAPMKWSTPICRRWSSATRRVPPWLAETPSSKTAKSTTS